MERRSSTSGCWSPGPPGVSCLAPSSRVRGGSRTHTPLPGHRDLNPARLPVPPPGHRGISVRHVCPREGLRAAAGACGPRRRGCRYPVSSGRRGSNPRCHLGKVMCIQLHHARMAPLSGRAGHPGPDRTCTARPVVPYEVRRPERPRLRFTVVSRPVSRVLYPLRGGGHPSWTAIADGLVRPTSWHRAGRPPALGLAPDGACLAAPVARGAGGLLHRRFTLTRLAPGGLLSVALFPRVAPGRRYRPSLPCGARTFLGGICREATDSDAAARPTRSPHPEPNRGTSAIPGPRSSN